ncbi:MAG TPA: hypothetical protein VIV09_05825 [Pseudolabrys sp.]
MGIANRALAKLGEAPLLAMTDNTKAGRTMNAMFDAVRDAELRRCRWKFAVKRDQLTALAAAPAWGYLYAYPLPADFLAIVQVNDYYLHPLAKNAGLWSVEGGQILTDIAPLLKVRYTARIDNAGLFDPLFCEALACKLAYEACEAITQSGSKKQLLGQDYKDALLEAARVDAIENPPVDLPDFSWLDSREGLNAFSRADGEWPVGTSGFSVA